MTEYKYGLNLQSTKTNSAVRVEEGRCRVS